jgi:uncharacterized membrane protein
VSVRFVLGIIGALLGLAVAEGAGLLLGSGLGMLVGWAIDREQKRARYLASPASGQEPFEQRATRRILELSQRVEQLEHKVAALSAASASRPGDALELAARSAFDANLRESPRAVSEPLGAPALDERGAPLPVASALQSEPTLDSDARGADVHAAEPSPSRLPLEQPPPAEYGPSAHAQPQPSPLLEAIRSFLFGGNTVVRIGILVLTVGVGLLVKYAADQAYFPLELRLALAAALGLALVVVGYRLSATRPGFGTALQGGGIAAMYLVTFFAFYTYHLLPAPLTMMLLIALAGLCSLLAVVQNAMQLAVFGAIGGFLSPVLASTGQGSHVALFSYYALLNAAIAGSALFRSWRLLNWVGFAFTFGIGSTWGALSYRPEHMLSASCFLTLFFLFYLLNGTLFALKQPAPRRGAIDTTLTFGLPLATLALAGALFRVHHLYLALFCLALAATYLASAWWLRSRHDEPLRALAQAYVAIGVGVLTVAIPFALGSALATALAWAAEAGGLVWVGSKQARLRTRIAGYLLFACALMALYTRYGEASAAAQALFCGLIALSLLFSARVLEQARTSLRGWERYVGHALLALALWEWLVPIHRVPEALPFVREHLHDLALLSLLGASVYALDWLGERSDFGSARAVARFAFPYLLITLVRDLDDGEAPFAEFAWLGFGLLFAACYAVLYRQQPLLDERPKLRDALHASAAYAVALVWLDQAIEVAARLRLDDGWLALAWIAAPLSVVLLALVQRPDWPIARHPRAYLHWFGWPTTLALCARMLIGQGESAGGAAPLPYLPLLNPFDLAQALAIGALLLVARSGPVRSERTRTVAAWVSALSIFVGLSGSIVRTAHHLADVPFTPWQVPSDPLVQAAFSILWTVLSLMAMLLANRRSLRSVWVAGAVLLAAVVLKLFLVDLDRLSSVAKIVTFLAVGMLLLLIGYFAPVPPARRAEETSV